MTAEEATRNRHRLMRVHVLQSEIHFLVSDQQDKQEIARLEQMNAELSKSLTRCRFLLDDCRSKLAANSNEQDLTQEDEGSGVG